MASTPGSTSSPWATDSTHQVALLRLGEGIVDAAAPHEPYDDGAAVAVLIAARGLVARSVADAGAAAHGSLIADSSRRRGGGRRSAARQCRFLRGSHRLVLLPHSPSPEVRASGPHRRS